LDLAIPLLERTLKAQEAKLGDNHPDIFRTQSHLAAQFWRLKKLDRSIPLFEQVLAARQKTSGPIHPDTLGVLANLAVNYRDAGRTAEAVATAGDFLDRFGKLEAANRPLVSWFLPDCAELAEQGNQHTKAVEARRLALETARQQHLAESPQFAEVLAEVSKTLMNSKQFVAAEKHLRECLAIREKVEPGAWTTFSAQMMLGAALVGQKKYADGESLLLRGYEGLKKREDTIPSQFRDAWLRYVLERMVQLYDAWNKPDEAEKWRAKLPPAARIRDGVERHHAWPLLWGWPRF
jgi:hypothetical protein